MDEDRLADLYSRCRALVVPNIEEFGIAAVEVQAAGRPVLAATLGGALETVVDGETGVLVPAESVNELAEAMMYTEFEGFSQERIRRHAERFSAFNFSERFCQEVARVVAEDGGRAAEAPARRPERRPRRGQRAAGAETGSSRGW